MDGCWRLQISGSFGQGMLANDRDFRLALTEVQDVKCDLEAAMRSTFLHLSIAVHLESISIDQEID